jgi:hypothetical protein
MHPVMHRALQLPVILMLPLTNTAARMLYIMQSEFFASWQAVAAGVPAYNCGKLSLRQAALWQPPELRKFNFH